MDRADHEYGRDTEPFASAGSDPIINTNGSAIPVEAVGVSADLDAGGLAARRRILQPESPSARKGAKRTEDEELLNRVVPSIPRARAPELAAFTHTDPWRVLRIQSELGRLIPIGVVGAESPDSTMTVMAFAEIPLTSFFLCSGRIGELSSNHCASLAIASIRRVATGSLNETTLSKLPLLPMGSL